MRKDYAKNMFTHKRNLRKKPPRLSVIVTVFLVAFIVSVTGFWVYTHHGFKEGLSAWVLNVKSLVKPKTNSVTVAKQQTPSAQEENSVRFDFYTELPKMQVNSGTVAELKSTSPIQHKYEGLPRPFELAEIDKSIQTVLTTKKSQSVQYTLQLGVFKDQISASQMRLSLLLAGIEADVVKMQNNIYWVRKGSFASENQAKSVQRQLSKKGFDSEIKPVG